MVPVSSKYSYVSCTSETKHSEHHETPPNFIVHSSCQQFSHDYACNRFSLLLFFLLPLLPRLLSRWFASPPFFLLPVAINPSVLYYEAREMCTACSRHDGGGRATRGTHASQLSRHVLILLEVVSQRENTSLGDSREKNWKTPCAPTPPFNPLPYHLFSRKCASSDCLILQ